MREEAPTITINENGDKYWRNKDGELHRIDGPAVEYIEGSNQWYQNGILHRIDGPAIEWVNGDKFWYQMGRQHRIDGPAIETIDGIKRWFIRGERFESKEAFFEALTDKEKEISLFSEDFLNA
jgi:hypothetical protein